MMEYSVKYSRKAISDLERIKEEVFQACQDEDTTDRYLTELVTKINEKKAFPESGSPLIFMGIFTGYRFVIYKAYIAFYSIENNMVLVDRILFGKSNYLSILNL